jgi:hypothetical protein
MNETPLTPMPWKQRLGIVAVLALIVAAMFHDSFKPELVLFSSDGPLGILAAKNMALPESFTGRWSDANWFGGNAGLVTPGFTFILFWLLGAVATAKFLAPLYVLSLGLAATFAFRVFGFRPMVCLLGGIAAELNSNFFSNACWGVGTRCSALAATFLALAAIWSSREGSFGLRLMKLALAGLATGMAVVEGADNGVFFSLFIGAFAIFVPLTREGSFPARALQSALTTVIVVVFSFFMAYQTVSSLFSTQIAGIVGMEQTEESKNQQWHGATMWSLPKKEILRVVVPGLFGYRMDTPKGGEYWGGVGSDPAIPEMVEKLKSGTDQEKQFAQRYLSQTQWRSSGAGEYAGILVILVAAWAVARSFSRKAQTYSAIEKKMIWFWAVMGFIAVLFAWGRHAPFYQLLYALPYFSTIRNPMKLMHPAHMTFMILFAYGLQGMAREYLEKARTPTPIAWDKRWKMACIVLLSVGVLSWIIYSAQKKELITYMTGEFIDAAAAPLIAKFSIKEVGLAVLVLGICVAAVLAIQAGAFRGARAVWAGVILGGILVGDFWRANAPWIQHYNYKERYQTNLVFDTLRERPWEHRVTTPMFQLNEAFSYFQSIHRGEWMQHQFHYFNIQSLDVVHEGGRRAVEKEMYLKYVGANLKRYWELSNTRFVFGVPGLADALNRDLDPINKSFRQHTSFTVQQKLGFPAASANGPFALIEFTNALPRAKLYTQWSVMTNSVETLTRLAAPDFRPESEIILADEIPAPAAGAAASDAKVEYTSYGPKHFTQRTTSSAPGVLLVNDRHHPDWKVTIDGQPAKLLRANFIVRAVQVPAGQHTIEWRFEPKTTPLYVTVSALVVGALLCALVAFLSRPRPAEARRK